MLTTKTNFDAKLSSLNRKITANKSKYLLVENEFKKLKTFDSSYFRGKDHIEEDDTQIYLVFLPMYRYLKRVVGVGAGNYIYFWKSKGLSDENITSDYSLNPQLSYLGTKTRGQFDRSCFKQDKVTFNHKKVVNIYIVYELTKVADLNGNDNRPTIQNALFGAFSLTKNADINKYKYSGYGTRFGRRSKFSFSVGGFSQNVIIFGVDMSSSTKIDNRKKEILILCKGPTQGLQHTLNVEKIYSIKFSKVDTRFCFSLHYNRANSYLNVNGTEIYRFKAKDPEIVATPLCLQKISKDWSVDNMAET